ncbi:type I-E CRISPR-associated protein Cse2/CasB [Prauserella marina]|uniref:CRISPR system Cascade subunit CasB n=1 Tax=Prauserella marina TaxID=530584 RepID=A0A222VMX5_9PSEU|nr:type I-E CRISPR-associated protein Cse2/CasB [Prauserella marina]ASR35276.1 type I-E CRISPR-associated protein Cse2/CasB [Prauserella marina]PWV84948.1 CRISPR system Cascade subunit CasB [Prauserella marina]SDC08566.1 CRISPR system Cascade subunit CasB [Prauserella marina]
MTQVRPNKPWIGSITRDVVNKRVKGLQREALRDRPEAVAALARLRRGVGKPPGEIGDILTYTLDDQLVREHEVNRDQPTVGEFAAHHSLTLYALHQQAQNKAMHHEGPQYELGRSIRMLIADHTFPDRHPVITRFQAFSTSDSLGELVHHLRGIIQLLRGESVPLDYGLLAEKLVRWQLRGEDQVRMVWSREFYIMRRRDAKPRTDTTDTTPENS